LPLALDVIAVDGGLAAAGHEQPAQDADERRLARAVRAEEAEDLAARHLQRDVVERADLAEVLRHVLDVDADVRAHSSKRPFTPRSTSVAMPALRVGSGSTSTFTPKTCSARCARVCTL